MAPKTNQGLEAARQFVDAVQESGICIQSAYLYGSYAKGTAHRDSDIDVALVSEDFTGWVDDLDRIKTALVSADPRIECMHFHPKDFSDASPLVWEIKTTGIQLVGNGKSRKRRVPSKRR